MAAGDTLVVFTAACNELVEGAGVAALGTRNGRHVLQFDDASNESAAFPLVMPSYYSRRGVSVEMHFAMSTAESGDVDWDVAFERIGNQRQDLDEDGFAAAQSADDNTVPARCGNVAVAEVAFADGPQLDHVAPGDAFRVKVTRDAANDTASGDAELLYVVLKEA